jgi:HEAT repeat protein
MKANIGWLVVLMIVMNGVGSAFQIAVRVTGVAAIPQQRVAPLVAAVAPVSVSTSGDAAMLTPAAAPFAVDDQDDPSYKLYKEGYKLILDEQWDDARVKFNELLSKYTKSKYVADAKYWTAYSLKYTDKKQAIEAYRSFLKKYPKSNYYDDATADLGRLEDPALPLVPSPNRFAPPARSSGDLEPALARAAEKYEVAHRIYYTPTASGYTVSADTTTVSVLTSRDPQLRMKVEAFQALLRSNQDDTAFELLKQTLLDPKQPYVMKETALWGSKQFEKKDLIGLYLQALQSDTTVMVRRHLLYQLGTFADRGDERVLAILTQTVLDTKQDRQVREAALIGLRSAKGHDVLDLYVRVAKSDSDQKFREMALYQIGQSVKPDDETAFKTLRDFILDKNQSREIREAALNALRTVKGERASDLYLEVAKSDPDERIQELALFSFVQANQPNPEKTIVLLKEIILDKSRSWSVRQSAMTHLARVPSEEALNFLVQVATTDPEERIRVSAINCISYLGKNKAKSRGSLMSLFRKIPSDQLNSINSLLYAIASLGGDESVDFLGTVAKTHENYEVRRTAIQYLGNIGGERARTVLVEIMNGK